MTWLRLLGMRIFHRSAEFWPRLSITVKDDLKVKGRNFKETFYDSILNYLAKVAICSRCLFLHILLCLFI